MAKLIKREWTAKGLAGKKVKRVAWGYRLAVSGKSERVTHEGWTKQDALAALVQRQREVGEGKVARPEERTLGQLTDEYLAYKTGKKKAVPEDARVLRSRLLPAFGVDLPVRQLTPAMIAQYERTRSAEVSP